MKKKKEVEQVWSPAYVPGNTVKTPDGERTILHQYGRSYELSERVNHLGKPRAWVDEDVIKEWQND